MTLMLGADSKVKCDRKQPCTACARRGRPELCCWDDAKIDPEPQPFAFNTDLIRMQRRLARIESVLRSLPPGTARLDLLDAPDDEDDEHVAILLPTAAPAHRSRDASRRPASARARHHSDGSDQSETEDAALGVEDVAFGGFGFRPSGFQGSLRSKPLGVDSEGAPSGAPSPGQQPAGAQLTSQLTSIVTAPPTPSEAVPLAPVLGLSLLGSPEDMLAARSRLLAETVAILPDETRSYRLVDQYLNVPHWLFPCLHPPAFRTEHDHYWALRKSGRVDLVDPLWLAVYSAACAIGIESADRDLVRELAIDDGDLAQVSQLYHHAAIRFLQLGDYMGVPRIRTLQCIIILGQVFTAPHFSNKGIRFLNLLGVAARVCQLLGLTKLGHDPSHMPADDPALPPGRNAVKRETAVRIFAQVCFMDWMSASARVCGYLLNPQQCDLPVASNVNFDDLSPTDWHVKSLPDHVPTDFMFERRRLDVVTLQRLAFDKIAHAGCGFSYETVLELDAAYRKILDTINTLKLPDTEVSQRVTNNFVWGRTVGMIAINSRLVRLHRPFLSRGYSRASRYRYSNETCLQSAQTVLRVLHDLDGDLPSSAFFCYSQAMSAALVLFNDLFRAIDEGAPPSQIDSKRDLLVLAYEAFTKPTRKPALDPLAKQAARVLSALFMEQDKRRVARAAQALVSSDRAAPHESFAQVLQRMARELALPPGVPASVSPTPRVDHAPDLPSSLPVDIGVPGNSNLGASLGSFELFQEIGLAPWYDANADSRRGSDDTPPDAQLFAETLRLPKSGLGGEVEQTTSAAALFLDTFAGQGW